MLDYLQPWVNCQSLPSMDKGHRTRVTAPPRMRGLTSIGKRSGSARQRSLTSIQAMVWLATGQQPLPIRVLHTVLPPSVSSNHPWRPISPYVFFLVIQCLLSALFMVCRVIFSSMTILHIPLGWSNRSPFSSTRLQNFSGVSYISKTSKFQHQSCGPNAFYWFLP
jgi:hypothetical protein